MVNPQCEGDKHYNSAKITISAELYKSDAIETANLPETVGSGPVIRNLFPDEGFPTVDDV